MDRALATAATGGVRVGAHVAPDAEGEPVAELVVDSHVQRAEGVRVLHAPDIGMFREFASFSPRSGLGTKTYKTPCKCEQKNARDSETDSASLLLQSLP